MSARRRLAVGLRHLRVAVALAAAVLALAFAACGGGGGGGGSGPTPPPMPGITFTTAGGGTVSVVALRRLGGQGGGTTLDLELRAEQVTDLYGVSFDLRYPSGNLRLDSSAEGPFLGAGGEDTFFEVAEPTPGRLVVGLSRVGQAPGADGTGVLLQLRFTAVAAGNGSLSFEANRAYASDGSQMGGVQWLGGSVQINL